MRTFASVGEFIPIAFAPPKTATNMSKTMSFYQEPSHYQKTILSDLQGAWEALRDEVIKEHKNKDCSHLLYHLNEAMSWESVKNLNQMKNTSILVQSIAQQINVSDGIMGLIADVKDVLYESFKSNSKRKNTINNGLSFLGWGYKPVQPAFVVYLEILP